MIAVLTLVTTLTLGQQQPSPEDDAAFEIYQVGRQLLEQGQYEEAADKLSQAYALLQNPQIRFHLGLAFAGATRCDEAITLLVEVKEDLESVPRRQRRRLEQERARAEIDCRLHRAKTADLRSDSEDVRLSECQRISDDLDALSEALPLDEGAWYRETVAYCVPYQTAFRTETAVQRAAYRLYEAAQVALESDDSARAIELYGKALEILPNEPVLLRDMATLQLRSGGCEPALAAWRAIPANRQQDKDRRSTQACERFPPPTPLTGPALGAYIADVVEALAVEEGGDSDETINAWEALTDKHPSVPIWTHLTDLLYQAERCPDYLRSVIQLQALGGEPSDAEAREQRCRQSGEEENGLRVATLAPTDSTSMWGWSALGSGLVALSVSGYFVAEWVAIANTSSAANEAEKQRLGDDSETYSILAWTVGTVGVGLAGVGLSLLLSDDGPTEFGGTVPWVGEGVVGAAGRF